MYRFWNFVICSGVRSKKISKSLNPKISNCLLTHLIFRRTHYLYGDRFYKTFPAAGINIIL